MTKAEALTLLKSTGEIDHFSSTENWKKVMDLYNSLHSEKAHPRCGSCYRKVKAWLLS